MGKRQRPELIEVFRPESPRHRTESAPTQAPGTKSRRLWVAPAVLGTIVAVVIAAAVVTDNGSSAKRATPAGGATSSVPASSAPANSVPASPTGAALPLMADTPVGFVISGVDQVPVEASPSGFVRQLWASNDFAERSSWLEVTAGPSGGWLGSGGDARVATPSGVAVFARGADGNLAISGPISGGSAMVTSSGLNRPQLAALFGTLGLVHGVLIHDAPEFGTTFHMVAGESAPDASAVGTPPARTIVNYISVAGAAGERTSLAVAVGPPSGEYEELSRRFFLGNAQTVEINGMQAMIGYNTRVLSQQSIVFPRDGLEVTITGTAPREVLVAAAKSMHLVSAGEWANLQAMPHTTQPGLTAQQNFPAEAVAVGAGTLASGEQWSIGVDVSTGQIDNHNPVVGVVLGSGNRQQWSAIDDRQSAISTLANSTYTAVIALIPVDQPGTRLVVTVGGRDVQVIPVDVHANTLVAGYAFSELSGFTARIVLAGGAEVATVSG